MRRQKILSLCLAAVLTLSLLPLSALAGHYELNASVQSVEVPSGPGGSHTVLAPKSVGDPILHLTGTSESGLERSGTLPSVKVSREMPGEEKTLEIEFFDGTVATGHFSWNGKLTLGRRYVPDLGGDDTFYLGAALISTNPEYDVSFSQPVRIFFPGASGLRAGFSLHNDSRSGEIEKSISNDTFAAAAAELAPGEIGKIDTGAGIAVWTTRSGKFYTYESWSAPGSAGNVVEGNNVYIRVAHAKGLEYFSKEALNKNPGETALSLIKKTTLIIRTDETGSYVTAAGGVAEGSEGSLSGWLYRVNGIFPDIAASEYELKAGDFVEFLFTTDGGKDWGYNPPGEIPEEEFKITEAQKADLYKALSGVSEYLKTAAGATPAEIFFAGLSKAAISDTQKSALTEAVVAANGKYAETADLCDAILAAAAAGLPPIDVGGVPLLTVLKNSTGLAREGAHAAANALILYDALGVRLPQGAENSRGALKEKILSGQKSDGGFGDAAAAEGDVLSTALALTALSRYEAEEEVAKAISKGMKFLSEKQASAGGYFVNGLESPEASAAVLLALTALGRDPHGKDFAVASRNIPTALYAFQNEDGGFASRKNYPSDGKLTAKIALSLFSYTMRLEEKGPVYDMSDLLSNGFSDQKEIASWAEAAALACQKNYLMTGDPSGAFLPKNTLKRSETAKIIVTLMGYPLQTYTDSYYDVKPGAWYANYVKTAAANGVVRGVSMTHFLPDGEITRQDFAVMLVRALKLEPPEGGARPADFWAVADYAKDAVETLYSAGVMVGDGGKFDPAAKLSREMTAVILNRVYEKYFS